MPDNRFFYPDSYRSGQRVTLTGEEAHHIKDVMRCQIEETIELVNGLGDLAHATITSLHKTEVVLEIGDVLHSPQKPFRIASALPLLRPSPFDWACEKLVEIGVDDLLLYPADLSERHDLKEHGIQRIKKLIESALKQSGRLFSPTIHFYASLDEVLSYFTGSIIWAEKCDESVPLVHYLHEQKTRETCLLLSGPEKGWSDREKRLLFKRATPVLLTDTILRAETAAISLAAITASHMISCTPRSNKRE